MYHRQWMEKKRKPVNQKAFDAFHERFFYVQNDKTLLKSTE